MTSALCCIICVTAIIVTVQICSTIERVFEKKLERDE